MRISVVVGKIYVYATRNNTYHSNRDGKINTSTSCISILSSNIPIASKTLKVLTAIRSSTTRIHKIPTKRLRLQLQ